MSSIYLANSFKVCSYDFMVLGDSPFAAQSNIYLSISISKSVNEKKPPSTDKFPEKKASLYQLKLINLIVFNHEFIGNSSATSSVKTLSYQHLTRHMLKSNFISNHCDEFTICRFAFQMMNSITEHF